MNLPEGWKDATFGEIVDINVSSIGKNYPFQDILYLDTGSVTKGIIEGLQKVKLKDAPSRAKRLVKKNSIIYSTVRPNQEYHGFIDDPKENLVVSTGFAVIDAKREIADSKFLYYFLSQEHITQKLQQIAEHTTSTYLSIKPEHIKTLSIFLPPLEEQTAISNILSSFDEKIELLREQNEILEQVVQVFFKEWFVDSADESWEVGTLGEEFDITIGRTPPRKESHWFSKTPTGMKWASIKDMVNSKVYIFNTSEYITDEAIAKFNIPIIPKGTVILSFKMTVGKLAITTEDMLSNEAIAHLKIKKDSFLTSEYIYIFLQSLNFNSLGSTSSIVKAINSTMIKKIEFTVPDETILIKFDNLIKPFFNKIKNNTIQIQTLEKIKNTLLPKLMNGEVRVDL